MKKIKFSLLSLLILLVVSCNDDGGTSIIPLKNGAVPNMTKSAETDGFLDLTKISNGENVSITFNADFGVGVPTSTDIVAFYTKSSGPVYKSVIANNVSLPIDVTLTAEDIVIAFSELSSTDDLELGDILTVTTSFVLDDGTSLNIINDDGSLNIGTDFQNSPLATTFLNYPVSCPSDLSGTYLVSSTGIGCCGVSPITDYLYTVTVTDNGGGSYSLSDMSGGVYDGLFCGPFGICGDASTGNITDVCGVLSGSDPDCCGDTISFSGTVNPDGTWSVEISSGFVFANSVWTKQ